MYKLFIRPLLFFLSPETAHKVAVVLLNLSSKTFFLKYLFKKYFAVSSPSLTREIAGLKFVSPVGLAAGFDKDAEVYDAMEMLGFGFVEIGTVTPLPQPGNPRPRLFRLKKDKALINRMGFNNKGVDYAVRNLKKRKNKNLIIGGNIGKNKVTPLDKANEDYIIAFDKLFPYVDYFVINVSSPNTPGLRKLQQKQPLKSLVDEIMQLNAEKENPKPVFLKISPDLDKDSLDDVVDIVNNSTLAGIIATNTTTGRENLTVPQSEVEKAGAGGLSGKPLKDKSTAIIKYLRKKLNRDKYIIGAGGIFGVEDAREKIEAGADLIQVFTGLIYEGPLLVKKLNKGLFKTGK